MISEIKEPSNQTTESINFAIIKIGNIPWEISTIDIINLIDPSLNRHKPNQDWVHIPIDRSTGKTLNDLFVEIPTTHEAEHICQNLDKKIFKQRALCVSISSYDELLLALINPELIVKNTYISDQDVINLINICQNYKVRIIFTIFL